MNSHFDIVASVDFINGITPRKEIVAWLHEHSTDEWNVVWRPIKFQNTVFFKNKTDAVLFKLTWG